MAHFPYVTLRSDVTFPTFFAVLRMASRFVNLSQDDIIDFCNKQENENTAKKTINDMLFSRNSLQFLTNRPYRLFTLTQWPRFRAKHSLKFTAHYD